MVMHIQRIAESGHGEENSKFSGNYIDKAINENEQFSFPKEIMNLKINFRR